MRSLRFRWVLGASLLSVCSCLAQNTVDVSSHFLIATTNERTTLDRTSGRLISTVDVRVANLGGRTFLSPLHCVVNLSTTGVQVADSQGGEGFPPYQAPYLDLTPRLSNGKLDANQTLGFSLSFSRPRGVAFTYDLRMKGVLKAVSAPELTVGKTAYRVLADETLTVPFSARDEDGDPVVLWCGTSLSNLVVSVTNGTTATGSAQFSPAANQKGIHIVELGARDPLGYEDREVVTITVDAVNHAPDLAEPGSISGLEGELITTALSATDPDNDPLRFLASDLPTNAILNPETGSLFFAPDFSQAGPYDVAVRVTDGILTSATKTLHVDIEDVSAGGEQPTNQLTLVVDPIQSPSLMTVQRITGWVNSDSNAPAAEPIRCAVISGLMPSIGEQGHTLDVVLSGASGGTYATHFEPGSTVNFGPGIAVNSLNAFDATQLTANITIAADAALGPRTVMASSGKEAAISVVAFSVQAGGADLSGRLIDSATSNALVGAVVTLEGTGYSTTTGPDGSFAFHGLPSGDYRVTINSPDHGLIQQSVSLTPGQSISLGNVPLAATVFDPSAPAGVSLPSVLLRGVGSQVGAANLDELAKAIRDTLLVVGGNESGIVDGDGNQLNPGVLGMGILSLGDPAIHALATRVARGMETTRLVDLLELYSFAFAWSAGAPPKLVDWLEGLQEVVNQAWANPQDPRSQIVIVIFNHGSAMSKQPPVVGAETMLNPFQALLLTASFWGRGLEHVQGAEQASARAVVRAARYAPLDDGDKRFSGFWTGFYSARANTMESGLNTAWVNAVGYFNPMLDPYSSLPVFGNVYDELVGFHRIYSASKLVPEPPRIQEAKVVVTDGDSVTVQVSFRRTPSEHYMENYHYVLYRYRTASAERELVNWGTVSGEVAGRNLDKPLTICDPDPLGSASSANWIYAMSVAWSGSLTLPVAPDKFKPWWQIPAQSPYGPSLDALARRYSINRTLRLDRAMISDYSAPVVVSVSRNGTPRARDMEVDPNTGAIYYMSMNSDGMVVGSENRPQIVKVDLDGVGNQRRRSFAYPDFDTRHGAGPKGMAVDASGNLYSENSASDASYGGRVFQFRQPDAVREFVGSLNYFSRDLMFAHPTLAGPMDMGPNWLSPYGPELLYVTDELNRNVRTIPVLSEGDPWHHCGEVWADLPALGGQSVDLETTPGGDVHILVARFEAAGLAAKLEMSSSDVGVDETVGFVLQVENRSEHLIREVRMIPILNDGYGKLEPIGAPQPETVDLMPGERARFEAAYLAVSNGWASVKAQAVGLDAEGVSIGSDWTKPQQLRIQSTLKVWAKLPLDPIHVPPGEAFDVGMAFYNVGTSAYSHVMAEIRPFPPLVPGMTMAEVSAESPPIPQDFDLPAHSEKVVANLYRAESMGRLRFVGNGSGVNAATHKTVQAMADAMEGAITAEVIVSPIHVKLAADRWSVKMSPLETITITAQVENISGSAVEVHDLRLEWELPSRFPLFEAIESSGPDTFTVPAGSSGEAIFVLRTPLIQGQENLVGKMSIRMAGDAQSCPYLTEPLKVAVGPTFKFKLLDVVLQPESPGGEGPKVLTVLNMKQPIADADVAFDYTYNSAPPGDPNPVMVSTSYVVRTDSNGYAEQFFPFQGAFTMKYVDPESQTGLSATYMYVDSGVIYTNWLPVSVARTLRQQLVRLTNVVHDVTERKIVTSPGMDGYREETNGQLRVSYEHNLLKRVESEIVTPICFAEHSPPYRGIYAGPNSGPRDDPWTAAIHMCALLSFTETRSKELLELAEKEASILSGTFINLVLKFLGEKLKKAEFGPRPYSDERLERMRQRLNEQGIPESVRLGRQKAYENALARNDAAFSKNRAFLKSILDTPLTQQLAVYTKKLSKVLQAGGLSEQTATGIAENLTLIVAPMLEWTARNIANFEWVGDVLGKSPTDQFKDWFNKNVTVFVGQKIADNYVTYSQPHLYRALDTCQLLSLNLDGTTPTILNSIGQFDLTIRNSIRGLQLQLKLMDREHPEDALKERADWLINYFAFIAENQTSIGFEENRKLFAESLKNFEEMWKDVNDLLDLLKFAYVPKLFAETDFWSQARIGRAVEKTFRDTDMKEPADSVATASCGDHGPRPPNSPIGGQ